MVPDDDEDRASILSRRSKLVATALVGLSLGCGSDAAEPAAVPAAESTGGEQVTPRPGDEPVPQPCLDLRVDDDGESVTPPPPPHQPD